MGAHRLWVGVVVGCIRSPFVGGGHRVHGHSSFICGGLLSSVGVVAAVPGHCLLWALGCSLWAMGHLVVGGQAIVRGWWLSLWVLGVRARWVVVRGSWAVVCRQWGSCVVYIVCGWWVVVHGQVCSWAGCLWTA